VLMSSILRRDTFEMRNRMQCGQCGNEQFTKAGRDRQARQLYRCRACGRRLTARSASAFRGYRFPDEIVALAVRWYLRFRLSYADLVELLAERGVHVDPSTIFDWVQHFTPLYQDAARLQRRRRPASLLPLAGRAGPRPRRPCCPAQGGRAAGALGTQRLV